MSAASDGEKAGQWLRSVGGAATPGEVGAALALDHSRQARAIRWLREEGFVQGSKRHVALTSSGWSRFGVVQAVGGGEAVDGLVTGWPAAHAAFVRLAVSAVVARSALPAERGHLGFLMIGETGTCKSSAAEAVAGLFGWAAADVTFFVPMLAPGELRGRREKDAEGTAWVAPPAAGLPFVFFDEVDKARSELVDAVWPYFQGEPRTRIEGDLRELRPVAMMAMNPPRGADRYALLRPEYRRRAVVMDTAELRGRGHEVGELLHRQPTARLDLVALSQSLPNLDDAARELLRTIPAQFTEAGVEELPTIGLALAARGRLALLPPGTSPVLAVAATAIDYMTVTDTVSGQVEEGWQDRLPDPEHLSGAGAGQVVALVAEARKANAARVEGRREVRTRTERESVDLIRERGELVARFARARDDLDGRRLGGLTPAERDQAAGLRGALSSWVDRAANAKTRERLADVRAGGAGDVADAETLVRLVASRRWEKEQERQQEREARQRADHAARHSADVARRQAREYRETRSRALTEVMTAAKPWETLYTRTTTKRAERPREALQQGHNGLPLVRFDSDPNVFRIVGGVLVSRAFGDPAGWWVSTWDERVRFPGSASQCEPLDTWGPGTRAVIAPLLADLHRAENQLRAELGKPERPGRPSVGYAPPLVAPAALVVEETPASSPRPRWPGSGWAA